MIASGDSQPRYRLGFRGDIEGLRAVAILLVVAAHAKVPGLAGGFVGVDVFYVLSGYLITGLLVQEIRATGELRFANFYARRLRRLLPAMLLMIGVSCVFGWLLLAPGEQADQASAAAAATLWVSNFHFAFMHMDYFAPGTDTNLFLHTWSLGVEEQFYLAWPLLLVLAMGAWTNAKRPPDIARLGWILLITAACSFALSLYWTYTQPQLAFYMMPSRAWQFALGALVLLGFGSPSFAPSTQIAVPAIALRISGWCGLGLIVASSLLFDDHVPYPGFRAIAPALGAALVLCAGAHQSTVGATRLLALRPLQAVGRVSYAWYLWHWPVLLLGAAVLDMRVGWHRAALALLALLIAALSYRFFETPIRRNRAIIAKPRFAVFAALALMVLAGSFALRWQEAAVERMKSPEQMRYEMARVDAPVIYYMGCDDWYHSATVRICEFGDHNAKHTAVAMGDSIGLQWFPAYARIFLRPGWRLLVITKSSCPMVDAPLFYARIGREYTECAQWRQTALRKIAALRPDVVLLGSTTTNPFSREQWIQGTRRVLDALSGSVGRIYLMRSTPILPFDGPSCLAPRSALYRWLAGADKCMAPARTRRADDIYEWLQEAAAPLRNVRVVNTTPIVCPSDVCRAQQANRIVFRDQQHLTASFAEYLAPQLQTAMGWPASDPAWTTATGSAGRAGIP